LPYFGEVTHLCMPLNMVSMAIYVTLEGKIPRTPSWCLHGGVIRVL